jgi:uncharacterized protein YjbI with pentapeptide repeats
MKRRPSRGGDNIDREEAIRLLRGGPDLIREWNERRERHEIIPDLDEADLDVANLSKAYLGEVNLRGADLVKANLGGANLSGADLSEANLSGADLSEANLSGADLSGAELGGADLSGANLRGANLVKAYLGGANLRGANLREANLSGANLSGADLREANLGGSEGSDGFRKRKAYLREANLSEANLGGAYLRGADLFGAHLGEADLSGADLSGANLSWADLSGTNLARASMVRVDVRGAKLRDCHIFGISAWDIETNGDTEQVNLVISRDDTPVMTVDNLKVAQFIYLLLNNEEIREVIDTVTSKVVLILGRFTPERKALLDAIRDELRRHNYLPVVFDFDKPASRGYTETITTLARMARFVIADLTDATEVRAELSKIVPDLTSVPVQPLILASQTEYVTFEEDIRRNRPWVLNPFRYRDPDHAIASLPEMVLGPAEEKVKEMRQ